MEFSIYLENALYMYTELIFLIQSGTADKGERIEIVTTENVACQPIDMVDYFCCKSSNEYSYIYY